MAQEIIALRPELSLYVTLEDDENKLLLEQLASNVVHGYFYRGEHDYAGWARILAAEVAEKSATPFYDELKNYVRMKALAGRESGGPRRRHGASSLPRWPDFGFTL